VVGLTSTQLFNLPSPNDVFNVIARGSSPCVLAQLSLVPEVQTQWETSTYEDWASRMHECVVLENEFVP